MHTRTSVIGPRDRARQRLANLAGEARRHATDDETTELDRLERLVRAEAITAFEAQGILRDVIRRQHGRQGQRAA